MCLHRNPSVGSSAEQLDELSVVGYPEEPEVASLFESSGVSSGICSSVCSFHSLTFLIRA
jgi:hypothetical protein